MKRSKSNSIRKQEVYTLFNKPTEVYTLFNKPINNPRALKDGLIDENEKESLRDLNEKMRAILGKHYEGHQIVSVQAAFMAFHRRCCQRLIFIKTNKNF
ncbi:hypothetical protein HpHA148_05920 [Helicobacter pylori]